MIRTPETDRLARAYGEASTAFRVHNAQTRPTDAQEAGYWTLEDDQLLNAATAARMALERAMAVASSDRTGNRAFYVVLTSWPTLEAGSAERALYTNEDPICFSVADVLERVKDISNSFHRCLVEAVFFVPPFEPRRDVTAEIAARWLQEIAGASEIEFNEADSEHLFLIRNLEAARAWRKLHPRA